jgi:hypothetical protein
LKTKAELMLVAMLILALALSAIAETTRPDDRSFVGMNVGTTHYDAQHLTSMGRQIAQIKGPVPWGDTLFYCFVDKPLPSSDVHIKVGYLYNDPGYWSTLAPGYWLDGAGDNHAPDLDLFGDRATVGYAHGRPEIDPVSGMVAKETWPYSGFFNLTSIPVNTCGGEYTGSGDASYGFPKIDVDYTVFGDTLVHVVTTESQYTPSSEMRSLVYYRGTSDPLYFGSCGTFIDSVMTRGAVIAADPYSDYVMIAYLEPRVKDAALAHTADNDVTIVESSDNGLSWSAPQNITNYQDTDTERAYPDLSILWAYEDAAFHIVWTAVEWDPVADTAHHQKSLLKHWTDFDYQITTITWAENVQSCEPGHRVLNVSKPMLSECDDGSDRKLYVVYTRFVGDTNAGTEDCSAGGYANGELYAQVSSANGVVWGPPVNLSNTASPGCSPGNCYSENWASCTRTSTDSLRILYIGDTDAGAYYLGTVPGSHEGTETECDVMFLDTGCFDMEYFDDVIFSEDDFSSPAIACAINESVDTTFTVVNRGNFDMYISHYIGGGSASPYLFVDRDDSYLPAQGRDSVTFTIEFYAPATPGTYTAELIVELPDISEEVTIPLAFEVTGMQEYDCGDVNLDGVVDQAADVAVGVARHLEAEHGDGEGRVGRGVRRGLGTGAEHGGERQNRRAEDAGLVRSDTLWHVQSPEGG